MIARGYNRLNTNMSTLEKNLYDRIAIKPKCATETVVTSKAYRGLSHSKSR